MTSSRFIPKYAFKKIEQGKIVASAPSNIALVKYWGKYDMQYPQNTSLSFTLNNCFTKTTLSYTYAPNAHQFEVFLDGKPAPEFKPKIATFLDRTASYLPFLKDYQLTIETTNSFPHSSGIASSASGFAALASCFMQMEKDLTEQPMPQDYFLRKSSFLARLGSGSAARSIEGPLVVWGEHSEIEGSSREFGVCYPYSVHENFSNYQDTILLVDKGEKQVSSTVGHGLMEGHPYAKKRFEEADKNIIKLKEVLKTGDLPGFIAIVESEALQLHAMMMSSQPYFILMKPQTLEIIQAVWRYRQDHNSSLCFTLDAGANVHLLYPANEKEAVLRFIKHALAKFCKNGEFIEDHLGLGSRLL